MDQLNLQEILKEIQTFLSAAPPDISAAKSLFSQAIELNPTEPDLLAAYGEFQCEIEETHSAIDLLKKSIALKPDSDASRYFHLGQLQNGEEALNSFKKGIEIVYKALSNETVDLTLEEKAIPMLCSAHCAIAELYMTDLCDEPIAEAECINHINMALEQDADSIEAHYCKAQYYKVIQNYEVAADEMRTCLDVLSNLESDNTVSAELRTNLCRTLIDLKQTVEAINILEDILEEDENDIQAWYVLACAYLVDEDYEDSLDAAEKALALLKLSSLWMDSTCDLNNDIPELIEEIKRRQQDEEN